MGLVSDTIIWLYHWQTLAAGVLALGGAWLTVRKIRHQIDQTDRHERERLAREHNAHRATLPLTLSGICHALRKLLRELDRAKSVLGQKPYIADFHAPPPTDHITELKEVVATTTNSTVTSPIAHLVREIQTLWARVETLYDKTEQKRRAGLVENINDWMIQAATTYALAESLFEYARGESDDGPAEVTVERVESVIFRDYLEDANLSRRIQNLLDHSELVWTRE